MTMEEVESVLDTLREVDELYLWEDHSLSTNSPSCSLINKINSDNKNGN